MLTGVFVSFSPFCCSGLGSTRSVSSFLPPLHWWARPLRSCAPTPASPRRVQQFVRGNSGSLIGRTCGARWGRWLRAVLAMTLGADRMAPQTGPRPRPCRNGTATGHWPQALSGALPAMCSVLHCAGCGCGTFTCHQRPSSRWQASAHYIGASTKEAPKQPNTGNHPHDLPTTDPRPARWTRPRPNTSQQPVNPEPCAFWHQTSTRTDRSISGRPVSWLPAAAASHSLSALSQTRNDDRTRSITRNERPTHTHTTATA